MDWALIPHEALADEPDTPGLLKLLTFLSPAFPVGSFSYSHGLEWLIDSGSLRTAEGLTTWLVDLLECGGSWTDALLFAEAHRAAGGADAARLRAVAELAEALSPSQERHLETMAQGIAFLAAIDAVWPCAPVAWLENAAAYSVAVAAVAAGHGIALGAVLPAYLNALAANLVSVGVRLVPLGQNAGLRTMATLHPVIASVADRAMNSFFDDLGSAALLSDIASMRHEQQYSRVFRT
jgi:urease accessory protein